MLPRQRKSLSRKFMKKANKAAEKANVEEATSAKRLKHESANAEKAQTVANGALPKLAEQINSARACLANPRVEEADDGIKVGCMTMLDTMMEVQAACLKSASDATEFPLPKTHATTKQINALIGAARKSIGLVNHMINSLPAQ